MNIQTRDFVRASVKMGINCLPVKQDKTPIGKWGKWYTEFLTEQEIVDNFNDDTLCAWIGGAISGNGGTLVCIDVDEKYNINEKLLVTDFMSRIPKEIGDKLLIAETQNKGYHLIFRSPKEPESAQKLANRETTAQEKNESFIKHIEKGKSRDEAIKLASRDRVRVLIETRENRSYFLVEPSKGYKFIRGKLNTLTVDEHDLLLETARSMNEYIPEANTMRMVVEEDKFENKEDSPFKAYNERGDVISLLSSYGWQIKKQYGNTIPLKRAGNSPTFKSADYFVDTKKLVVYSTSTSFPVNVAMSPSFVYCFLEHNENWGEAAKSLASKGYGRAGYHKLGKYARELQDTLREIASMVLNTEEDDILKLKTILLNNLKEKYGN